MVSCGLDCGVDGAGIVPARRWGAGAFDMIAGEVAHQNMTSNCMNAMFLYFPFGDQNNDNNEVQRLLILV